MEQRFGKTMAELRSRCFREWMSFQTEVKRSPNTPHSPNRPKRHSQPLILIVLLTLPFITLNEPTPTPAHRPPQPRKLCRPTRTPYNQDKP